MNRVQPSPPVDFGSFIHVSCQVNFEEDLGKNIINSLHLQEVFLSAVCIAVTSGDSVLSKNGLSFSSSCTTSGHSSCWLSNIQMSCNRFDSFFPLIKIIHASSNRRSQGNRFTQAGPIRTTSCSGVTWLPSISPFPSGLVETT